MARVQRRLRSSAPATSAATSPRVARATTSSATSCCSTSSEGHRRRARRSTSSRTAPVARLRRAASPAPTSYDDTAGSDVVIITAGVPRKPGMSARRPAVNERRDRPQRRRAGREALARTRSSSSVTNPLDAMVHARGSVTGFPRERVVGMAGVLDSAPLPHVHRAGARASRSRTSRVGARRPRRHHGAAAALLHGRRHPDHRAARRRRSSTRSSTRTRNGGGEIVKLLKTGSAYYAPGRRRGGDGRGLPPGPEADPAVRGVPRRRVRRQGPLRRRAGEVGAGGVEQIIEIELTARSRRRFDKSAAAVQRAGREAEALTRAKRRARRRLDFNARNP